MWVYVWRPQIHNIGIYGKLTNSYCLLSAEAFDCYYKTFENCAGDFIPIVRTTIGNCRIIGCLTAGNRHGLLVPDSITEVELQHLRNNLPESVKIRCIEDRLSALGNVIACNDHVALVHPDIDKETEEIIADVLNVEVFRRTIADNPLVGSCLVLSNRGGLLTPNISTEDLEELSSLLQVPLLTGTVNNGENLIASGLLVNDWVAFAGCRTSFNEANYCRSIFKVDREYSTLLRSALLTEKRKQPQSIDNAV